MKDLDDFMPSVMVYAPNASMILTERYILEAATEICIKTKMWREFVTATQTRVDTSPIELVWPLVPPDQSAIVSIETLSVAATPLEERSLAWMDQNYPNWLVPGQYDGPTRYFAQIHADEIAIFPAVASPLETTARLVLKPALKATSLPDFLYDHHATLIGKYAASRILITPNANGEIPGGALGTSLYGEAMAGIDRLMSVTAKSQARVPIRTKARFF